MKTNHCAAATRYAERIMKASSLEDLARLGAEVKASINTVVGWESWLRDIYISRHTTLSKKEVPDEEYYNAKGLKKLKEIENGKI